jgi:hypothetical protein
MAIIIKGNRKGEVVKLLELKEEFAVLSDGEPMRLGMLEVDDTERQKILKNYIDSDTFKRYEFGHFLNTNRFKKINWLRV